MKKSLLVGLISLAATVAPCFGQGIITLDNYLSNGGNGGPTFITYGNNVAANGTSGAFGTPGAGIGNGWTVGFYWVAGNQVANVTPDASGFGIPSGGGLTLATGTGSTAASNPFNNPGEYLSTGAFTTPGVDTGGTITVELLAYGTSAGSYANAGSYRAHSAAFTMTVANPTGAPAKTGEVAPGFSVLAVPEPSIFALASLGGAFLMLIRRKK
jgi:hypothetical protein